MMRACVVLPAMSEEENLAMLLPALSRLPQVSGILVCSFGPDGATARLLAGFPRARLVRVPQGGLGPAILAGMRAALRRGPTVTMDADISHSPQDLERLLWIFSREKQDVLLGSRYAPGGRIVGWDAFRHFLSRAANSLARLALRSEARDLTGGFRVYSPRAVRAILKTAWKLPSHAYSFQLSSLALCERSGLRVAEAPITFRERVHGESKTFSFRGMAMFAGTLLRLAARRD